MPSPRYLPHLPRPIARKAFQYQGDVLSCYYFGPSLRRIEVEAISAQQK